MLEDKKNDNNELENYGVWVKSGPENYIDTKNTPADNDFELTDLESNLESNPDNFLLTEEEESLLDSLEKDVKNKENEDDGDFFNMQEVDSLNFEDEETKEDSSLDIESSSEIDSSLDVDTSSDEEEFIDIDLPKAVDIDDTDYPKTSKKEDTKSVEIISKIAADLKNDLSVIKNELHELKKELAKYKKLEEKEAVKEDDAVAKEDEEKEVSSGFFSDDGDETIALTGDELDNLFNTAEITEESAEKKAKTTDTIEKKTDIEEPDVNEITEDSFETPSLPDDELSEEGFDIELELPELEDTKESKEEIDNEAEQEIEIDSSFDVPATEEEIDINDLPEINEDLAKDEFTIDENIEVEESELSIDIPQEDESIEIEESELSIDIPQEDESIEIEEPELSIGPTQDESIEIEEPELSIDDIPQEDESIEIEESELSIDIPQEDESIEIEESELSIDIPQEDESIEIEEPELSIDDIPQEDESIEIEESELSIGPTQDISIEIEESEITDEVALQESAYEENKDELNFLDGKIDEIPEEKEATPSAKIEEIATDDDSKKELTEEDFEEIDLGSIDGDIKDDEELIIEDDISIESPKEEVIEEITLQPEPKAKKAPVSKKSAPVADEIEEPEITIDEEIDLEPKKQEKIDTKKKPAPEKSKAKQKETHDSDKAVKKESKALKEGAIENIPDNLKTEIKSVLVYLDQLLEALPDKKIDEFAKSEHFKTYKK
ncbi:MAG: hypothetical protein FWF38_07470, partial [Spirochaetaceae bacterium]|nr:hypothetical protein [Spirochaetaceae bacterium]